ncbi:hypothetical protein ACIRQP_36395 [Streptomyces sp. NPDC102274]|uniref:hypothetical protein n=1 Tax=Streptomyces sp. NPDC102274 TaxID=3366151 RepID=UPI0037F5A7CA
MSVSSVTVRTPPVPPSVVVVGAGPRGTGFLERIAANARSLYDGLPLDSPSRGPVSAGCRADLAP